MTTDKPKWWQSWMVYTLIGLLLTLVPYVGGYFLLGRYNSIHIDPDTVTYRVFDYEILRTAFGPLGWAEAKLRGETVIIIYDSDDMGYLGFRFDDVDFYKPGW
ncbi:hypothetical protein Pan258_22070 [Symmachiella dynata]|uniref:hypothetical protein n=1 Tax=Symmachiella dynata TaxID=2527995 RepID=UPI00118A4012|nr:hypothetical protein [Symmachiella dynata]QDT48167.1 hypothetical protein Pan258_22070 [Symmachiella dynata]